MNRDLYAECLVKKEKQWYVNIIKGALILLDVIALCSCAIFSIFGMLFLLVALGASYFGFQMLDLEYEYIFVTSELTIDTIFNKSRRKKAKRIDMTKIEVMAPAKHPELTKFLNNPNVKIQDFSSGSANAKKYGIYFAADGKNQVVLFEPNDELLHVMKSCSPRKVILE